MSIFPLQITPDLLRSLKAFTARSSERDAINDEARISSVERCIELVLKNLNSEKRGLIERVKHTVVAPPNGSPENVAAAGAQPSAFQQAEVRLQSLDRQIEMFQRIKTILDGARSPVGP